MPNLIQIIKKAIDDFFEQHKSEIYSATVLILITNLLFAIPFTWNFLHTGMARNFMIFGSAFYPATFLQFSWQGIQWLAFADIFIFLPVIIWSMLMPSIVDYVKSNMQSEEE